MSFWHGSEGWSRQLSSPIPWSCPWKLPSLHVTNQHRNHLREKPLTGAGLVAENCCAARLLVSLHLSSGWGWWRDYNEAHTFSLTWQILTVVGWCNNDFDELLPRRSTARWSDVGELLPRWEEAKEAANVAEDLYYISIHIDINIDLWSSWEFKMALYVFFISYTIGDTDF